MSAFDPVDVAIVGSGMAGAVAALRLAQAGLQVVCLEQGGWTTPAAHPHARPDYEWERLTSFATSPNIRQWETDYPVDTRDEATLMWNGVGGSTVHYTGTWPRLRPSDFRKGTEHGCQPDWPFTYEDLEPFYDQVDRVSGIAGCMGDRAMPERMPYQTRPLPPGPIGPVVARGFDRLGWHWWPMPEAIIADPYDGRLPCNNCGNCQSGCPRGSLNDMSFTYWPKALAAGAQLRAYARAERIASDDAGRATGVEYVDLMSGQRFFQPARVVVMAANGVGTPRLLLLSATNRFPNGLANGNDLVGRHLMHHGLAIVEGWVDEITDPHKGVESAVLISSEFAETDVSRGFINGFTMHIVRMNGAGFQALGSHSRNTIPWGAGHHAEFRKKFGHGISVVCMGDDLPLPENRVTLSETLTDSSGLPAPKIDYRLHANDRRMMDFAIDRAVDLMNACDAWEIKVNRWDRFGRDYAPPAFHLYGTCRMGVDPETSVTNQYGQAWEVPNLFIMDGSLMPTGGAINPTSTIGSVALRCADHLAANIDEIAG
ncbi:MAG: GMC family oxidoreductase [Thermomicrobiales bacterium]